MSRNFREDIGSHHTHFLGNICAKYSLHHSLCIRVGTIHKGRRHRGEGRGICPRQTWMFGLVCRWILSRQEGPKSRNFYWRPLWMVHTLDPMNESPNWRGKSNESEWGQSIEDVHTEGKGSTNQNFAHVLNGYPLDLPRTSIMRSEQARLKR